jgi:hypothetical protein
MAEFSGYCQSFDRNSDCWLMFDIDLHLIGELRKSVGMLW